jgi:hypothetical protein
MTLTVAISGSASVFLAHLDLFDGAHEHAEQLKQGVAVEGGDRASPRDLMGEDGCSPDVTFDVLTRVSQN